MSIVKRVVQVGLTVDDYSCGNFSLSTIRNKLIEK